MNGLENKSIENIKHMSKTALMRVVPIESAVSGTLEQDESIFALLSKATKIALGPCKCRETRASLNEGNGEPAENMCIYLNESAEEYIKQGSFHEITVEQALEVISRAEKNGCMHQISALSDENSVKSICSCSGGTCLSLRIASQYNAYELIRSNYTATVNEANCAACGQCVESCPVNAVKLGVRTTEYNSPDRDGKSENVWNKGLHSLDYRTCRSNVERDGSSPCKAECPAHISVQAYIELARQERYGEALELIKKDNPFPAVCGRICNKPCEAACSRGIVDDPVAIDEIKRFVAEQELKKENRYIPKMLNITGKPFSTRIAVIGAGPAGLSCAYYLAVKGYPVTVFDKNSVPGGMLTNAIPSFRLDKDVTLAEIDVLKNLGVEFRMNTEVGKDTTISRLKEEGYKAFCLAIGTQSGNKTSCPGENLKGVVGALDFLESVSSGERPVLGRHTVILGGGNVAIDAARTAVRLGCEEVTVVYRRTREDMTAARDEIAEAEGENIQFRFLLSPVGIIGQNKVSEIRLEKMALGEPDASGRNKVVALGEYECVPADTVIEAVGQSTDWGKLIDGTAVRLNSRRLAVADAFTCQTDEPEIFVCGDALTGPKFAITAIAAGKRAAESIHRFVTPGQSLTVGRTVNGYRSMDRSAYTANLINIEKISRRQIKTTAVSSLNGDFADHRCGFTEKDTTNEVKRCLKCGVAVVNTNMCIGCGQCVINCKFDSIKLVKVRSAPTVTYGSQIATPETYIRKHFNP